MNTPLSSGAPPPLAAAPASDHILQTCAHIDTQVQTCTQSNTDVLVSLWYFLGFSRGPNFSCAPLFLFPRRMFKYCVGWHGSALSLGFHKDELSCSSSSHARASGIIFFTHTQSQLMTLYSKRDSPGAVRQRPAMGSAGLSQQRRQQRIDTHAHTDTH